MRAHIVRIHNKVSFCQYNNPHFGKGFLSECCINPLNRSVAYLIKKLIKKCIKHFDCQDTVVNTIFVLNHRSKLKLHMYM